MSLLILILAVLVVLALALYLVQLLPLPARDGVPSPGVIKSLISVVLVAIAIVFICERAGFFR